MRTAACVLLLVLAIPVDAGDDFKLEPGFKLIFNGKNLDGWKEKTGNAVLDGKTEAYKGRFKVVDKKIVIDPSVKGDVRILTAAEYKDVHLKFQFKLGDKCNNDMFLRGIKFDIVPKAAKNLKADEWNEFEIITKGDKGEVKINGETAKTYNLKVPASPFEMRAEFGAIEFRNMRAKE